MHSSSFRQLLRLADQDGLAEEIAAGMRGFEAKAPEFFATLVGIDPRVEKFWDRQKRDQARLRLAHLGTPQLTREVVESWANLCSSDGFDEEDVELLRTRLGAIAPLLPSTLLIKRRIDVLSVVLAMAEDDNKVGQATAALRHLLKSSLFNSVDELSQRVLRQIILRYPDDEKYRGVIESVRQWNDELLKQFLSMSEDFLVECSEDRPEDVIILFEAASELANRRAILIPDLFRSTLLRVLTGEIQAEWNSVESIAGKTFVRQLETLLERYPAEFSDLSTQAAPLMALYRAAAENPDGNTVADGNEGEPR